MTPVRNKSRLVHVRDERLKDGVMSWRVGVDINVLQGREQVIARQLMRRITGGPYQRAALLDLMSIQQDLNRKGKTPMVQTSGTCPPIYKTSGKSKKKGK